VINIIWSKERSVLKDVVGLGSEQMGAVDAGFL
jgi:hypothetical protein